MTIANENAQAFRDELKPIAVQAKQFADQLKIPPQVEGGFSANEGEDRGEMIANAMLAYRHLEDAIMRFGKVMQAVNGGKSIYDK